MRGDDSGGEGVTDNLYTSHLVLYSDRPDLGSNTIRNHFKYFNCSRLSLPATMDPIAEKVQK